MIDLRSDTVTRPSEAMREAAAAAEVGDDKRDGDPTVGELEARVADLLGMEDALYAPSGTMANQAAIRAHTDPGDEVVVDRLAHVYTSEYAAMAQLSNLQARTVDAPEGVPAAEQVAGAIEENRKPWPGTGLVSLENTHNKRGGVAAPPGAIDAAAEAAGERGVPVHLDGARLANASVALDRPMDAFTRRVDSAMFDLSKGLGAPVGAVLAGSGEFVERARHYRGLFGGEMRQAGVTAAPALLALENVDRLAADHDNARRLAEGLADAGLDVEEPETNIVLADASSVGLTAESLVERCREAGVGAGAIDGGVVRFVVHLDVDADDVDEAVRRIDGALG